MISPGELAKIPLFDGLGPEELGYLSRCVPDIRVVPGEYIVQEGDTRALYITIEGHMEVTKLVDGVERVIGNRLPGALFGEAPMVLNTPFPASLRAVLPSRVTRVGATEFHTLATMAPEPDLVVVGPRFDPAVQDLPTFLDGNREPFDFLQPADPLVAKLPCGPEAARACWTGARSVPAGNHGTRHLRHRRRAGRIGQAHRLGRRRGQHGDRFRAQISAKPRRLTPGQRTSV